MRQLTTVLVSAIIATTTSAGMMQAQSRLDGYELSQCKQLDLRTSLPVAAKPASMARGVTTADLNGKYFVQWDDLGGNSPRQGFDASTNITFSGDSAYISNFFGLDFTAKGKFDVATQTIQLAPQAAFTESPYGTFWLCPFDTQRGGFYSDPTAHFDLTITSDGHLQGGTLGWVIVIADKTSTYYGSAVGMSREIRFKKTNASMSGNLRNITERTFSPYEYRVYVEQNGTDDLLIANIATNGREVHMLLKANKTWVMEPQVITTSTLTGASCTFPAVWSATANQSKGVNADLTGEGDVDMLEFGPWGVFRANALLQCSFGMESSVLMLDAGNTISWPTATEYTFEGAGTQANPYKIASVNDFVKLSRRVSAGEKFTGVYFQQTADINFADLSGIYYPIGVDATLYFDGIFDGNGKAIRNLRIERGVKKFSGLFGYVGANGRISNVNIINGYLSTSGMYNGFIAGQCMGKIDNVKVNGQINSATEYNGGVAGYSCSVRNSEFIGSISGQASTGGITGELHWDTVANCHVSASITSAIPNTVGHAVGGIVGGVYGASSGSKGRVQDCYFLGSMTDQTGYAHTGGIAGSISSYSSVARCAVVGVMTTNVTASTIGSCGSIVGSLSGGGFTDCYASTGIQATKENAKTGGLVGLANSASTFVKPEISNSVYTGQVRILGIPAPERGIYGNKVESVQISNTYADMQVSGLPEEQGGLLTSQLTNGQPLQGLDAEVWQFTANQYPMIKNLMPANATALAVVPAYLSGTEKINNVKNDITLTLNPYINWSLYENQQFVQETAGMKIEGDKAKLKGILSQEFLVASLTAPELGGTFSRIYLLNVAPSQFEGAGTQENPYLIKTVNDMKILNTAVTMNGLTFEGDYFALVNDLDFSGVTDFYGVADDSNVTHAFNASFDGRGHVIKNWKMNGLSIGTDGKIVTKDSRQTTALFGIIGEKGEVKNLVIDSSCSFIGNSGIASTVAICSGKIENIRNYASITAAGTHAAGIVARMAGTAKVTNCYNAGTICCGGTYAAGIVSEMQDGSQLSNCQNDGRAFTDSLVANTKYSATAVAAGIVGNTGGSVTITNCVNQGDLSAPKEVAGIVGRCANGTVIKNCISTGVLTVGANITSVGSVVATNLNVADNYINNYYDGQVTFFGAVAGDIMSGCNALNTSVLTSGQPLNGLDADVFDFQAGKYPVLKAFKDEQASIAWRSMNVSLAAGEVVNEISSPATLGSASGMQWSMSGSGFTINGNTLTPQTAAQPGQTKLTASVGNISRSFNIQSVFVPFQGAGTQADPYRLDSFADWQNLSKYTNTYGFRYEGKYFALSHDVEFDSTVNFMPIAFKSVNHFRGQIDGRGHILKNVYIEFTDRNHPVGNDYVGLVGMLGRGGALRNLSIDGRVRAFKYVGSFAGRSYGDIENCHLLGYVGTTNNTNTGGIVAEALAGSITHCTNKGTVWGNYTVVGGIASYAGVSVYIDHCANLGTVMAKESVQDKYYGTVGGICGTGYARIKNCYNKGIVMGSNTVGGVVANLGGDMDSCVNYIELKLPITDTGTFGGVAGRTNSGVKMTNCYNYAPVTACGTVGGVVGSLATNSTLSYSSNHAPVTGYNKKAYTGGVVGTMTTNSGIDSCANYANVISDGTYTGGILGGANQSGTIDNCVNYADVESTTATAYYLGGIAGAMAGKITNTYNYGEVKGLSYAVGGISGYGSGKAYNCVNLGNVSTTYNDGTKKYGNAGGIWGNGATDVHDCINYGDVSGNYYVGGIQGYATGSTKVSRVYFSGKLTATDGETSAAIIHVLSTQTAVKVDSAYYNTELAGSFPTNTADSERAIPVLERELVSANLGEAFDYHQHALPTLKVFENNCDLNAAANIISFKNGEHKDAFATSAFVKLFPQTQWTVTPNLKMDGNKIWVVATQHLEPATVTVKGNRYNRTFNVITSNGGTIVNGLDADKTPLSVKYYTVAGVEVKNPVAGTTVIVRTVYTDGTTSARKVVVR